MFTPVSMPSPSSMYRISSVATFPEAPSQCGDCKCIFIYPFNDSVYFTRPLYLLRTDNRPDQQLMRPQFEFLPARPPRCWRTPARRCHGSAQQFAPEAWRSGLLSKDPKWNLCWVYGGRYHSWVGAALERWFDRQRRQARLGVNVFNKRCDTRVSNSDGVAKGDFIAAHVEKFT